VSLKVGRFGIPISQRSPSTLEDDGVEVRFTGWILGTAAVARSLARQLVGYVDNPDEPIVPVIWSDDSGYTGFYRFMGAEVSADAVNYPGHQQFRVTLERVPSCALPMTELRTYSQVRSNSYTYSTTSAASFVAVPISTTNWDFVFEGMHRFQAKTSTGDVLHYGLSSVGQGPSEFANARIGMNIAPADWYTAGCEVTFDGVHQAGRWATTTSNWVLSNGMVRVRPTTVAASNGALQIECWDSTNAWRAVPFIVHNSTTPIAVDPDSCTITRNGPETASVRVTANATPAAVGGLTGGARYTLDLTVRRGTPYIEGVITAWGGAQWGLGRYAAEAATLVSGGIIATSSATGTRWVVGMPYAFHQSLTSGWVVSSTTRSTVPFMVAVFGNDPSVFPNGQYNDSALLAGYPSRFASYMDALAETQHVVTR
jgi:hypothetical protein